MSFPIYSAEREELRVSGFLLQTERASVKSGLNMNHGWNPIPSLIRDLELYRNRRGSSPKTLSDVKQSLSPTHKSMAATEPTALSALKLSIL